MASSKDTNSEKSSVKKFWESWKKFNHSLGNLIAKLQLTLLYFTILAPFGLWTRLRVDPLGFRPKPAPTYWHVYSSSSSKSNHPGRE